MLSFLQRFEENIRCTVGSI